MRIPAAVMGAALSVFAQQALAAGSGGSGPGPAPVPDSTGLLLAGQRSFFDATQSNGSGAYQDSITYTGPSGGSAASLSTVESFVRASGTGGPLCFSCDFTGGGQSVAQINYGFRVNGGSSGDTVPLLVTYSMDLSTSDVRGEADGAIFIFDNIAENFPPAFQDARSVPLFGGVHSLSFTATIDFQSVADTVYMMRLQAAGVGGDSSASTYSAFVDPFIEIDPAFLILHPEYSLELGDGVLNTPPGGVPEPDAWALMLLGFGGLGAALRAHRSRAGLVQA